MERSSCFSAPRPRSRPAAVPAREPRRLEPPEDPNDFVEELESDEDYERGIEELFHRVITGSV